MTQEELRDHVSTEINSIIARQQGEQRHTDNFGVYGLNGADYTVAIYPGTSKRPHQVRCTRRVYPGETGPLEEKTGVLQHFSEPRRLIFEAEARKLEKLVEGLVAALLEDEVPVGAAGAGEEVQADGTEEDDEMMADDTATEIAEATEDAEEEREGAERDATVSTEEEHDSAERDSSAPESPAATPIAPTAVKDIPLARIDLDDTTFMFRADLRVGPLKASILSDGQQMPVVVRKRPDNPRYQLISGFRRVTALKELGMETVSAIIRKDLDDDEKAFKASVLENTARKTYSDIDRALVIREQRRRGHEQVAIAQTLALSDRQVRSIEKLLDLPDVARSAVDDPDHPLSATHAVTLSMMARKYEDLDWAHWVKEVEAKSLSVASLKRAVNAAHRGDGAKEVSLFREGETDLDAGVYRLQPAKIVIADLSKDEKGRLAAELEGLLAALRA